MSQGGQGGMLYKWTLGKNIIAKCSPSEVTYNQAHSNCDSVEAKADYCSRLALQSV